MSRVYLRVQHGGPRRILAHILTCPLLYLAFEAARVNVENGVDGRREPHKTSTHLVQEATRVLTQACHLPSQSDQDNELHRRPAD